MTKITPEHALKILSREIAIAESSAQLDETNGVDLGEWIATAAALQLARGAIRREMGRACFTCHMKNGRHMDWCWKYQGGTSDE